MSRVSATTKSAEPGSPRSGVRVTRSAYRLVPFEEHMEVIYTEATVVVSRSGGMTAELTAVGMPAVLVPLPGAPGDHQTANAEALAAAGAAVVVADAALDAARLDRELQALLDDPDRRAAMSAAARTLGSARRDRALRRPGGGGGRWPLTSTSRGRTPSTSSAWVARA